MSYLFPEFLSESPGRFISSFCDAESQQDFKNQLGKFTPCFTDVVILGVTHLSAVLVYFARLSRVCSGRYDRYRLLGIARAVQLSAIGAAVYCFLVPLFQLNARLGASNSLRSRVAPYEWAAMSLAVAQWLLLVVMLAMELERCVFSTRWVLRAPVVVVAASELVKLRFVLVLTETYDYFFWLYISYVVCQLYLAALALCYYPDPAQCEVSKEGLVHDYQPLPDGEVPRSEKVCPEATANVFSLLTFSWMGPLIKQGYKEPLIATDIWKLPPGDRLQNLDEVFSTHWSKQLASGSPSLLRACWLTTRGLFLSALPFKLTNDAAQLAGPMFLNLLLTVVNSDKPAYTGYMYAALLYLCTATGTLCDNQHFQRVMRSGFRLKAVLNGAVHRKVFYLTPAARARFTSGRIFNLISSDAETIQQLCQGIFGFISSPLRIIVAMFLLYRQLGPASFVAIGCILAIMPANAYLVRLSSAKLRQGLQFTDERTKLEGELIAGVEVVKCSIWEEPFKQRIDAARDRELKQLWRVNLLSAVIGFLINAVPTIVPVATFMAYIIIGHQLSAAEAFTSLALFNVLRFPLFQLPQLFNQYTQARVSLKRLEEFLAAEQGPEPRPLPPAAPGELAIRMQGDFAWNPEEPPSLTDFNLQVPAGQLVAIVGSTGGGKSTLLSAMLGLTQQVHGPPVVVRGRVAYVPQSAFIIAASVRDNILFGKPYEEAWYRRCVEAACLTTDFEQLPGGDQTELGDRGVNVSGGQKQRISMARALYSRADVYLLDDVLSALDSKVGRRVFAQCVQDLLRDKTVVLTTNQLQFVNSADQVLFMHEGRIAEQGGYQELMDAGGALAALMKEAQVEEVTEDDAKDATEQLDSLPKPQPGAVAASATPEAAVGTGAPAGGASGGTKRGADGRDLGKLTDAERSAVGGLSPAVIGTYIQALGGVPSFVWLLMLFLVNEGLRVGTTVWLSVWTGQVDTVGPVPHGAMYYMGIYAAISGAQLLAGLLNSFDVARLGLRAGRRLHDSMLRSLLRAPMAFFHATPLGRIINRVTKDTADVDRSLAGNASFALRSFLQLVSTVVLVGVVAPFALPALVIVLGLFYFLYQYFQASVRQVKRMDATSRSPVFTSVSEAIGGLATIRAFGIEKELMSRHAQLVDGNVIMSLVNMSMNRWLSVRLETLGALSTFAAASVAVEQQGDNAAMMGLLLSYALQITTITSMTLRLTSMAEQTFNAVERLSEYTGLPEEAPPVVPGSKPEGWPEKGVVEFQEVRMRYRPGLPLVLKGVSFRVESRHKCGVVGRTGAGKSSMIGTLFRLTELDAGRITIDGIDVAKMGLKQLRGSLALIPQVPVLFTGSIRSNLSPFGMHNDAELWNALRRAHLEPVVSGWPGGLEHLLTEGGAPLSAGQKQLLALARALLNPSRVLVLDEATANVDVETDALIQKTMRTEFSDRTIIAVAHRLHTIIDCEAVLVLDHGLVAEYGSPKTLLSKPDGMFTGGIAVAYAWVWVMLCAQ